MKLIGGFLIFFWAQVCFGQQTTETILEQLVSKQASGDHFYDDGLFPSQRSWKQSRSPVEDNTIFFTASIVHTLQQLLPMMSADERDLAEKIILNAQQNYPYYQSRKGEPTFNFWQTRDPDLPFPNGNKWVSNPRMRLPDDLDTSILISMGSDDDSMKFRLRQKMVAYAARENRGESELNTLSKYEKSNAYEVWFAKEMPQTFDFCVLTNAMYFVLDEDYLLNRYDSASILLIKKMLAEGDLSRTVDQVSHHTTSPALLLYHMARLIEKDDLGVFEEVIPLLERTLVSEFDSTQSEFEKMLITTSLIRLQHFPLRSLDYHAIETELDEFVFFSVKPFLGNPKFSFLNKLVPDITWKCEALNWALYLEHLYLSKTFPSNIIGTH